MLPEDLISHEATPVPVVTVTPEELAKDSLACEEARFVTLLNLYRKKNNLGSVAVSEAGVDGARWHAQDMNDKDYFSHTEPDGRNFSDRARAFGYPAWGENIAAGNSTAAATFCQWKNSAGHNTNMLRAEHKTIGIGLYSGTNSKYRHYWVNTFGPETQDSLSEPFVEEGICAQPTILPPC